MSHTDKIEHNKNIKIRPMGWTLLASRLYVGVRLSGR